MGSVYEGILRIGGVVRASRYKPFLCLTMEIMKPRKNAFKSPRWTMEELGKTK